MKPESVELHDLILWTAWKEMAVAFELSGADMHESFKEFLEEDYFRIVRETNDAGAAMEAEIAAATVPFQPMVDPASGVGTEEASSRRALLERASADDHDYAVKAVAEQYEQCLAKRTVKQFDMLPKVAPPKFAASIL